MGAGGEGAAARCNLGTEPLIPCPPSPEPPVATPQHHWGRTLGSPNRAIPLGARRTRSIPGAPLNEGKPSTRCSQPWECWLSRDAPGMRDGPGMRDAPEMRDGLSRCRGNAGPNPLAPAPLRKHSVQLCKQIEARLIWSTAESLGAQRSQRRDLREFPAPHWQEPAGWGPPWGWGDTGRGPGPKAGHGGAVAGQWGSPEGVWGRGADAGMS